MIEIKKVKLLATSARYFLLSTLLITTNSFANEISAPFENIVATVNQHQINVVELYEQSRDQIRQRFYHGKPPEQEQKTFMLEMTNQLVDQYLLSEEAKRRAITPEQQQLKQDISDYEAKHQANPAWSEAKAYYLPMVSQRLQQLSLVERLKGKVEEEATLDLAGIKAFYDQHPEKFTQPPQIKASLILLAVAPNARGFVWQAAKDQASNIIEKLDNGADFANLAELHSTDPTAEFGGDMDFLHQGMTAARAEEAMAGLEVGQYTPLVMLLDGVAIFKVTDRKPAQRHTFAEVEQRAGQLANKTAREQDWQQLKEKLRRNATINIDQEKLLFQ